MTLDAALFLLRSFSSCKFVVHFRSMSNDDELELIPNETDVFELDDETETSKNVEQQWIDELRVALERGCDFGSIRNIGKCRPLTSDLRLRVWKVKDAVRWTRRRKQLFTLPSDVFEH